MMQRNQLWSLPSNKPTKAPSGVAILGNRGAAKGPMAPILEDLSDVTDTSINNLPTPRGGSNGCDAIYVLAN